MLMDNHAMEGLGEVMSESRNRLATTQKASGFPMVGEIDCVA